MIDGQYWSCGISLTYYAPKWSSDGRAAWSGIIHFYDHGFIANDADATPISTRGKLYADSVRAKNPNDALTVVIDSLKRDAEQLGITWEYKRLYYRQDGEDPEFPPPANWRALLAAQAERIGWTSPYRLEKNS